MDIDDDDDDDDDSNCNGHPCSISRRDKQCNKRGI